MTEDLRKELRGILLVSLFILVVPLVFFPRNFGLTFDSSLFLLLVLELIWYLLVVSVTFKGQTALRLFLFALSILGYRLGLGMGFAILLLVMFPVPFSSSLDLGIHRYVPAFVLQILMAPFALKSLLAVLVEKTGAPKAVGRTEVSEVRMDEEDQETVVSRPPAEPKDKLESTKKVSFERESRVIAENKLENILRYLREYAGVKAAVLLDQEGLVVAEDSSEFDSETVASFARCFKEMNDQMLQKMGQKASERIGIHTPDLWICLNRIGDFTLVVLSDRRTDELLSVRISQSMGMITRFMAERYGQNELKVAEV